MSRGLLSSAQTLLAGVLALARTRLELFGTELQEALARLFFTLIGAMAVLLLCALGLAFAAFGAVLSVGEEHRALAAVAVAAAFVAAAFAAAWSMRRLGEDKPRMFCASLAAAQSMVEGVRGVLYWAVQLAPLYSLLRHNISRRGENR